MHKTALRTWVAFLVLAWVCPAQFETAVVLGTVRDSSDSPAPGAAVTLTSIETGIKSATKSDQTGSYQFLNVRIGTYRVSAELAGFATAAVDSFAVRVNARQRVDLVLKVGAVSETVQVTDAVKALETDSSDRGQVIGSKQIVELPLNGRNYSELALLTAGVRRSAYAFANPPREGSFNANGQRSTFNNFLLDGVDNNAYGTSNQGFSNQVVQASPDTVAEFKVVTNNMSAEYGRTSGAVINASMKSGTNEFHGSAWEFVRNTRLNAVGYFKPVGNVKPVLQRNQFGFTFGGPIAKNRAFFFTDYEGFRELQKVPSFSSIPTLNDRLGIFDKPVRNAITGEVFPANTPIPPARITPFARTVLASLPTPTSLARANNFNLLRRDKHNNDKMNVKLDGQVNSRMSAFVRLSHRKSNIFQQPDIPGPSGGGGNGFVRSLNQQLALGFTYTVTPASLLEIRMGISKTRAGKEPFGLGGPSMQALFGIPGLSEDPRLSGGLTNQNINGYTGLGRQATNPQWQHPFLYNPRVNYSRVMGKHSLKAGYEYQRIHTEVQDVNPLYGFDSYDGQFSRPAGGAADNATYNLADFMFGQRASYSLVNFFVAQYRQVMNFGYVQDDFKLNSKLTLNLGARYEYATPQWESGLKLSNFDPSTNKLIPAAKGSISNRAQVNPDRNNFAPRVGFAYSLNAKTVVRGGYGISYVHFNRAGGGNLLAINGPQVVIAAISQTAGQAGFRPTEQGYPAGLTDPARFDPIRSNISYMPRDTRTGYVQNWFLSVQREVAKNTVVDLAYVGNRSNKLLLFADFNQARPNAPTEDTALQLRRPNQSFGPITLAANYGWANYNALQVKVERRYADGFFVLNSFTYSKGLDNVGQALEDQNSSNGASVQNFYNLAAEKGPSGYDQTFNNTTSLVWQVPIGKNRRFAAGMPAVLDGVIGGWQISAIHNMWSGEPINLRYSPAAASQVSNIASDWRGAIWYRPNVNGPAVTSSQSRTIDNYLNAATVTVPTDRSQPFGNAGRNVARSHALYQADMGVQKDFHVPRENTYVQFRAEFFNLLNKSNFRPANPNRSNPAFGTIRGTFPARQIQFALKVVF